MVRYRSNQNVLASFQYFFTIVTNIADRNITENVCDLYKRSNWIVSDFRVCDSSTLDSLHRTYCMHRCELWDLNCEYVNLKWHGEK